MKLKWAAAIVLLAGALLCMVLVGERFIAALFNVWKFGGYPDWQGIDLSRN